MKRLTSGLLPCVLGLLLPACSGAAPRDEAAPDTASQSEAAAAPAAVAESGGLAYPALYGDLALPELPGGIVESTGRQTTSLRDGLVIRLRTSMPVAEVRDYYSRALDDLGWEEAPSRALPGAMMAGMRATKDGVSFRVTITSLGDTTQVSINVRGE